MIYPIINKEFQVNDHLFWDAVEAGRWELSVIEKLCAIVKPTDIVFDVGAWIGVYSLLLSQLASKVIAFEPCGFSRQILIDNLAINDIDNVTVESIALSDCVGEEMLYYYNPTGLDRVLASSMLNMGDRSGKAEGLPIKTTTIDTYCRENSIKPDGVKIDVEGHEGKVLAGCTLDCWKVVEFHPFGDMAPMGELIDGNGIEHRFIRR